MELISYVLSHRDFEGLKISLVCTLLTPFCTGAVKCMT